MRVISSPSSDLGRAAAELAAQLFQREPQERAAVETLRDVQFCGEGQLVRALLVRDSAPHFQHAQPVTELAREHAELLGKRGAVPEKKVVKRTRLDRRSDWLGHRD